MSLPHLTDKLRAIGYENIHKDLVHLQTAGYYKDGVPEWARLVSEALRCASGSGAVTSIAWEFVATEAIAEVSRLKGAIGAFSTKVNESGPYRDTTAVKSQGDDPYYYEIDATPVEALLKTIS